MSHFGILKFLDKGLMHGCQLKYLHKKEIFVALKKLLESKLDQPEKNWPV